MPSPIPHIDQSSWAARSSWKRTGTEAFADRYGKLAIAVAPAKAAAG